MREMQVWGIQVQQPGDSPVLLLREVGGDTFLPIWVRQEEATAIVLELERVVPINPLTHDLIVDLVAAFGRTLLEVQIVDLREGDFKADLVFDGGLRVPARLSDSVNIALRVGCPLYVDERLLDEAGVVTPIDDRRVFPGTLLVSPPAIVDPQFAHTVLYVVEHNHTGSLAVILNRPSDTPVRDVLPQWEQLTAPPRVVFDGGPVAQDARLGLAMLRSDARVDDVPGVWRVSGRNGRIVQLDLDVDPTHIAPLVEEVRIFAGYSEWLADIARTRGSTQRLDREERIRYQPCHSRSHRSVDTGAPWHVAGPPLVNPNRQRCAGCRRSPRRPTTAGATSSAGGRPTA